MGDNVRLVIDDERIFPTLPGMTDAYCRTAEDAIVALAHYVIEHQRKQGYLDHYIEQIWWDHDLGDNGGDIMDVVAFMEVLAPWQAELAIPAFDMNVIHSRNPIGARTIAQRLDAVGYNTYSPLHLPPKTTVIAKKEEQDVAL